MKTNENTYQQTLPRKNTQEKTRSSPFTHSWLPTAFHPGATRGRVPTLSCNPCPAFQAPWTTWGDRKDPPATGYCSPSSQPSPPPWNRYRDRVPRPRPSASNSSSNRAPDCFCRIQLPAPASPPCNRSRSNPSPPPVISRFEGCWTRFEEQGSCARSRPGSAKSNTRPSCLISSPLVKFFEVVKFYLEWVMVRHRTVITNKTWHFRFSL